MLNGADDVYRRRETRMKRRDLSTPSVQPPSGTVWDVGEYDDPGWADALKRVWAFPFVAFLLLRRRVPRVAMLIGVRRTFVALVTSMFSILVVLGFIGMPWTFGDSPVWAPFLIAGIAAYATGVSLWIRRRALPCSSEQQLAGAWAGACFISIGVFQSVALMGFVLTFIADGNAW